MNPVLGILLAKNVENHTFVKARKLSLPLVVLASSAATNARTEMRNENIDNRRATNLNSGRRRITNAKVPRLYNAPIVYSKVRKELHTIKYCKKSPLN